MSNEYVPVGGPCRRQCDVDKETLVCKSCGLSYKLAEEQYVIKIIVVYHIYYVLLWCRFGRSF